MTFPLVSVIIVNYNGAHYLQDCLDGLRAQSYPVDCFEVIVSDNGSTDGSVELLQANYPWVKLIDNRRNLGFASGNNVAIRQSRSQYVVLLNNDTTPTPHWLKNLVSVAENNPQAGMLTGRLQLFYDQIQLAFDCETITPPNDGRTLGINIFSVDSGVQRGVVQYLEGFYGRETFGAQSFRWTTGHSILGVPVPHSSVPGKVRFELGAARPDNAPVHLKISLRDHALAELDISGFSPTLCEIELPAFARQLATPLIQNAGSIIFSSGAGRDRGTFVRNAEVFYEVDSDQYNTIEPVFAACGANMLIRKSLLDDVGFLDDDFFMYYEDTDLSWRARLRGWEILYVPKAIVRHIHCGSSVEWSPFFIYHAERNRLAMLFKNGSPQQIVTAWCKFFGRTAINTISGLSQVLRRRANWKTQWQNLSIYYRVLGKLFLWLPKLWRKRRQIQKIRKISEQAIQAWFME